MHSPAASTNGAPHQQRGATVVARPRLANAVARAGAVALVGLCGAVALAVVPGRVARTRAERAFERAAAPVVAQRNDRFAEQLTQLQEIARRSANGTTDTELTTSLSSMGWTQGSPLRAVALVEWLDMNSGLEVMTTGSSKDARVDTTEVGIALVRTYSSEDRISLWTGTDGPALVMRGDGAASEPGALSLQLMEPGDAVRFGLGPLDKADRLAAKPVVVVASLGARGRLLARVGAPDPSNAPAGLVVASRLRRGSVAAPTGEPPDGRGKLSYLRSVEHSGVVFETEALAAPDFGGNSAPQTAPFAAALGVGAMLSALMIWRRTSQRNAEATRSADERLARDARSDRLTGLANRRGVREAVDSRDRASSWVLLLVDIDRFKIVNGSWGRDAGDAVLRHAAERLRRVAEDFAAEGAVVPSLGRLSADEFVVLIGGAPTSAPGIPEGAGGPAGAGPLGPLDPVSAASDHGVRFAERALDALREPMALDGGDVVLSASIGLAPVGAHATFSEVLADADLAMGEAKREGGARTATASSELRALSSEQLDTEIGLREALKNDELVPYFQPIVDEVRRLRSFEALIRWAHPTLGLRSPGSFLRAAKAAGLLGEVSTEVLAKVCAVVARWNHDRVRRGLEPIAVHVNCVEEQLCDLDFPDTVAALLARYGLDPSWIVLEVSEETAAERLKQALPVLHSLRSIGVGFSLDDFGFGNASLTMLRDIGHVIELKLDKSLVDDLALTPTGCADTDVVDSILGFARKRGITIVAEGVETEAQWAVLRRLGVTRFQGFLFSRPVDTETATQILEHGVGAAANRVDALHVSAP